MFLLTSRTVRDWSRARKRHGDANKCTGPLTRRAKNWASSSGRGRRDTAQAEVEIVAPLGVVHDTRRRRRPCHRRDWSAFVIGVSANSLWYTRYTG